MISYINRIPFSLWLSAGVIYAAACRPTVPTADDLADLAAVVDEARELAPVARALCGAAGSPECAEVATVVDRGLDEVAPVLDAVLEAYWDACGREDPARAWRVITYVIDEGAFKVELKFPEQVDEDEDLADRRPAAVRAVFGEGVVDYSSPGF